MQTFEIQPLRPEFRGWVAETIEAYWGSTRMMSRWRYHETTALPAFIALSGGKPVGLATYYVENGLCELVTLNSFLEGIGLGEALLFAVRDVAKVSHCSKLWLTTSNDNLPALQFYQKRAMRIVAAHAGAIDEARKENEKIPLLGHNGIPCRDELELEMKLVD